VSMALVLQGVKDYVRGQYGWTNKQVTIRYDGQPPATAADFHIAFDDGGSTVEGPRTYMLQEQLSIVAGVWRRMASTPDDRYAELIKRTNIYTAQVASLDKLVRQVVTAIHHNFTLTSDLNTIWGLPNDEHGSIFESTLTYDGHNGLEKFSHIEAADLIWVGRRLRFTGLRRQQKIGSIG
jgi:hypothetical protein